MEDEEEKKEAMAQSNLKLIDLKIPESNEESLKQTLGIAHYNLGVEFEHSGQFEQAKENYLTAQDFAFISANTEHLKAQISQSLIEIQKKIESQKSFENQRQKLRSISKTSNFFNDSNHIKSVARMQKERELGPNQKFSQ